MDLNTVAGIVHPIDREAMPRYEPGDAFLAGGTWLYSEPQADLRRLVDLTSLGWPAIEHTTAGLRISATCTLQELEACILPDAWQAAPLIGQCCRALLGSFKIRAVATVGGNLCLALPASPMAALAFAMGATCTVWAADGGDRLIEVQDLIIGANHNSLSKGEVLRAIMLPEGMLMRRTAFRQMSLTQLGRSAALLIGTRDGDRLALTITGAVARPLRLDFATMPSERELAAAIDGAVPAWYDDLHGRPDWRQRITHLMAAEIRHELDS